jgi:hypothetical protein
MPATTRSSTRQRTFVSNLNAAADTNATVHVDLSAPANHGKQWTVTDQRTLIRMCRHTEMTPAIMAATLGRSEESIRYRLARLIHEHLDGRTDDASIREVSNWLLPN